jgi:hypothetical protein
MRRVFACEAHPTARPFHAYARGANRYKYHTLSLYERESGVYVLENSLGDELKVAIKNKLSTALYRGGVRIKETPTPRALT